MASDRGGVEVKLPEGRAREEEGLGLACGGSTEGILATSSDRWVNRFDDGPPKFGEGLIKPVTNPRVVGDNEENVG